MKKKLLHFFPFLMTIMVVGFTSCSDDDDNNDKINIVGNWVTYKADASFENGKEGFTTDVTKTRNNMAYYREFFFEYGNKCTYRFYRVTEDNKLIWTEEETSYTLDGNKVIVPVTGREYELFYISEINELIFYEREYDEKDGWANETFYLKR